MKRLLAGGSSALLQIRLHGMDGIWDLSIKDRISGYEPDDVGSIPAGPAIFLVMR